MKKGQSLIIEFIIFFLISFSLFAVISSFFFNQNEFFKERIGDRLIVMINNLVSIHIIRGVNCKSCDSVNVREVLPSKIGGYYYRINLTEGGLNTTLISQKLYSRGNPLFNLNKTFTFTKSESKSENKIIEIQINNKELNKKIEVIN